jgi:Cu/Ag efflux protein CusF
MKRLFTLSTLAALTLGGFSVSLSQTNSSQQAAQSNSGISANRVVGEVTAVDANARRITLKADGGSLVVVEIDDKTSFMKAQPGAKNLEGATKIALSDVTLGDRVLAMGKVAEDQKSVPARAVIVMTKGDIAQKHERDRAEWRRRGIVGVVTALNPETKEISVDLRSREGAQSVVIAADSPKVEFRRYAPDSVKFSDAKPSSFSELKVGDQVRALGDRSADGARFTPEEIVSGSFRNVTGSVVSVDAAANEIKVNDQKTKQTVTILIGSDSLLKKIPAEMGAMMAMRAAGGGGQGGAQGGGPGGGPGRAQGTPGEGGPGRPGGGPRMRGGFDFQDMLERLPATTVSELKPGDMVVVSSTQGADPSRATAIAVVAGVDAIINAMQARQAQQGGRPGAASQGPSFGDFGIGIGLP